MKGINRRFTASVQILLNLDDHVRSAVGEQGATWTALSQRKPLILPRCQKKRVHLIHSQADQIIRLWLFWPQAYGSRNPPQILQAAFIE